MAFVAIPALNLRAVRRLCTGRGGSFAENWKAEVESVKLNAQYPKNRSAKSRNRDEDSQDPQGASERPPEHKKKSPPVKDTTKQAKKVLFLKKREQKLEQFVDAQRRQYVKDASVQNDTQDDLSKSERLHKYMSRCGLASRRSAERIILEGRVTVNGETVSDVGRKINPFEDEVMVDNKVARLMDLTSWVMLHKPTRVLSTVTDDRGRETVSEFVQGLGKRLVPVGRLDRDTTGLLILTNDYSWVHKLSHPSFMHKKSYFVTCRGHISEDTAQELRDGILLPGEEEKPKTAPANVKILEHTKERGEPVSKVLITIREGRNRQIRRMFYGIFHEVITLHRESFAGLRLGSLKLGESRLLLPPEIIKLKTSGGGKWEKTPEDELEE
ncbi:hypothetical protein NDN08_000712 [Rhodosorus marinus]|uniref:RNA-binding S4 domain-containing protein n=1 Tax=Rhodosorus marinus TaxID=101924 RepID=A0AAV8UNS6_9RHOD|nr:hypothetical protein NDN08_000712 [Rhodosorus marinus]